MNLNTRATAKTVTGAAKGRAAALGDAPQQALDAVRDARRGARRQVTRARIAAARARAGSKAKASNVSSKAIGVAGAAGLAAGYFLDPDSGKRRRHVARDRTMGLIRRGAKRTRQEADYVVGTAEGKVEAAKSKATPEKPAANDQALAERVKSEIFQPADAPKDSVNINVENGVVYLRGQVKRPDEIKKLVKEAESVDGVRGVENLLHPVDH
jgi:osmotically-inducible protein OsmY